MYRLLPLYEFLLFWRGGLSAKEAGEALGLRRETVQRDLVKAYADDRATRGLSIYDARRRRIIFQGKAEDLRYAPRRFSEALGLAQALQSFPPEAGLPAPLMGPVVEDVAGLIDQPEQSEFGRRLYAAAARGRTVRLDYAAKLGRSLLEFSPHAFIRAPWRVHARGYGVKIDETRGHFIDIAPARIISCEEGSEEAYIGPKEDQEWRERTDVTARLKPDLPPGIAAAIRREHGLEEEAQKLIVKGVRRAVAPYVAQWLMERRVYGHEGGIWIEAAF